MGLAQLTVRDPARDRVQDGVELLLGAVLDADLPALIAERDEVGRREGDEVAYELGRRG